jgi:hypothetical protein
MSLALETICAKFGMKLTEEPATRVVALKIIELAQRGVRDAPTLSEMSQRAIHRIEQGHSEPRRTTLLAIESLLRKAGFKIEERPDGGFSMVVPGTMLGEPAQPVDVAAPSLANFWPQETEDESEATEPARH